jgi:putative FmdB family regulatory protein
VPRYEYECQQCDTHYDVERPMSESSDPHPCPFCGRPSRRIFTPPKFLFKADPNDNRPIWHSHGVYGHSHAPGRGFHGRDKGDPFQ